MDSDKDIDWKPTPPECYRPLSRYDPKNKRWVLTDFEHVRPGDIVQVRDRDGKPLVYDGKPMKDTDAALVCSMPQKTYPTGYGVILEWDDFNTLLESNPQ